LGGSVFANVQLLTRDRKDLGSAGSAGVAPGLIIVKLTSTLLNSVLLICALSIFGCQRASVPLQSQATPTPAPTQRCWIYDKIYPATAHAYRTQHVSMSEQNYVKKLVRSVPPEQRSLLRWIRDPDDNSIYVFVKWPQRPGYPDWNAVNTNIIIDTNDCSLHAFPRGI